MLGSGKARRFASMAAVVGVLVAVTACDPVPEPSDHIEVTYLDIPDDPEAGFHTRHLNSRGQLVALTTVFGEEPFPFDLTSVVYLWDDGQVTRFGEEGESTMLEGLSNKGHVVGRTGESFGKPHRPFLWVDGEWTMLPGPPGADSVTQSSVYVNDHGMAAGTMRPISGILTPTVWHEGEIVTAPVGGLVAGINNSNQVLVQSNWSPGRGHEMWDVAKGTTTRLGEDIGDSSIELVFTLGMNDQGMVLGWSRTEWDGPRRSVLWHKGETTDLGTLGGDFAYPSALNEWGQVVGLSTDAEGNELPFLWYQGEMTPLDMPDDEEVSGFEPIAINNWGQVVGLGDGPGGGRQPYLWQNGRIVDLGELVEGADSWPSTAGLAINDSGQIAGTAWDADGDGLFVMWEVSPTWGYDPDGL